jgi:hypothetical protein
LGDALPLSSNSGSGRGSAGFGDSSAATQFP